jgi:hypothetical protein
MGSKLIKNLLVASITVSTILTVIPTTNYLGFNYIMATAKKEIKNQRNSLELKEKWVEYKESCLEKKSDPYILMVPGYVLYHSFLNPGRPK